MECPDCSKDMQFAGIKQRSILSEQTVEYFCEVCFKIKAFIITNKNVDIVRGSK